MNIICNSCIGGFIYKNELKTSFKNPFIWNIIDFNSMYYMVKNFNQINFNNYELIKDKKWNFSIVIDGKVKIQYVHYKFDSKSNKPITKYIDVYYNKIWEFIIEKYESRLKRMKEENSNPLFLFANWFNKPETLLSYNQLKILNDLQQDNIIVAVDKIFPEFKNLKQITRETNRKIWNPGLAKKIYDKFIK